MEIHFFQLLKLLLPLTVFLTLASREILCGTFTICPDPSLYSNMDSTLNFRISSKKKQVTEKLELLAFSQGLSQKRRDNSWRGRKTLSGSQCRTLTFGNTVSLRLLVSCPEPLQFQSKWQCFSESLSRTVSTTKNWIYKSSDVLVEARQDPHVGLKPLR